jgi:hypothetical protein
MVAINSEHTKVYICVYIDSIDQLPEYFDVE